MTKSAFCAASQAWYRKNSAGSVTATATTAAMTAPTATATSQRTSRRRRPRCGDGEAARIDPSEVAAAIDLERERTHESDPAYGIRKLVDIAERTVAEPFDDPTTAVQALDRIHHCLRLLVHRAFPSGRHCDAHGEVRVIERILTWDGYVRLAFDEIRLAGATSPQIARKLRSVLEDLLGVAPDERREPLQRQIALLEAAVRRHYDDDDAAAAAGPDPLGLGAGRDVLVSG